MFKERFPNTIYSLQLLIPKHGMSNGMVIFVTTLVINQLDGIVIISRLAPETCLQNKFSMATCGIKPMTSYYIRSDHLVTEEEYIYIYK